MVQKVFGGEHTNRKLDIIENYLKAYMTALKGQAWCKTMYIDAFAGSGEIPQKRKEKIRIDLFTEVDNDEEENVVFKGSARRAMDLSTPFSSYKFIDKNQSNILELNNNFSNHANFGQCEFICGDANDKILELCEHTNWKKTRAVVFLDPFGNSVAWSTIVKLAETKAVDLWYLFPSGLGVFRQISKDGKIDATHIPSIDRLYGNTNWQTMFVRKETSHDLLGTQEKTVRNVTPSSATTLMIQQMKEVFEGGVLDQWVPLGGDGSYTKYSLIFAWANPSTKACNLAKRLGAAVLKASEQ